jgi:RNA polymerase sigma factor (sigma-70 family)
MTNCTDNERDIRILRSFLNGDDNAFSFIYNKYVDELFSYGTGLGFEREILKDAIQDTFVKFYMNKTQLKTIVNLKYYLFRMLKNHLLDIYKSAAKENPLDESEYPFLIEPSVLDELIADEEKANLELRVGKLLQVLTDRQKEAVYLRFIQEMEYEEVAGLLDMTAQAVRKLISRAIKRMRDEKF